MTIDMGKGRSSRKASSSAEPALHSTPTPCTCVVNEWGEVENIGCEYGRTHEFVGSGDTPFNCMICKVCKEQASQHE